MSEVCVIIGSDTWLRQKIIWQRCLKEIIHNICNILVDHNSFKIFRPLKLLDLKLKQKKKIIKFLA